MSGDEIQDAISKFGALMETAQGALSVLYAATSGDVIPGGFYGPDSDGGLRENPTFTAIGDNASDEILGDKLWSQAEKILLEHSPRHKSKI